MKKSSVLFLITCFILVVTVFINYPKLKLISGYAAKSMASHYFLAHDDIATINNIDHGSFLIGLAKTTVDKENKTASATVFGFSKSTAQYREGVGATLINDETNLHQPYLKPHRTKTTIAQTYPHGHLKEKDSIFSHIDYAKLFKAVNKAFKDDEKITRSILVLHKGHLIAEKYRKGFDQNSLFQGWSMTKTLVSTSFGVLQNRGYDIHKPITAFAPWLKDDRKNITTNHLLHMETGFDWVESYSTICDVTNMLFKDHDITKRPLESKLKAAPGATFYYQSGNANILSALLRKQFKNTQDYLDFPYQSYIDKIGMHSMTIETDVMNNYAASSYSWATTRDWAKFGQLFLQNGQWNQQTILPKSWIDYIKTPNNNSNNEYGGQWWLNKGNVMPNIPTDCFFADGFEGQRIFVIPSKDLVIVHFGIMRLKTPEDYYDHFDAMMAPICNAIP